MNLAKPRKKKLGSKDLVSARGLHSMVDRILVSHPERDLSTAQYLESGQCLSLRVNQTHLVLDSGKQILRRKI